MKKILVPTDLSPVAELGLTLAVQIAKRTSATISLVNFTRHPLATTFTAMGDIATKVDEEGNLYTIQLLNAQKEKLKELSVRYGIEAKIEYAIVDEEFKDGLDGYLRQEQIDLIVMGTTGEENAHEAFIGNHTEQAIKIAACPVLSVRDGFAISNFSNIVVALTVIDDDKIKSGLRALHELAKAFNSTVHIVHVIDRATDSSRDMNAYFSNLAIGTLLVPYTVSLLEDDEDDVVETVLCFAKEVRAGLVAVIKDAPGHGFRIFSHHFSDRAVKEEGRPVFTVNSNNQYIV